MTPDLDAIFARVGSLTDLEALAREVLPHMVFEYIAGGAGDEVTLRENRSGFDRIRLRPRALVDVSHIDTRSTLFGCELEFPFLLAPAAYQKMMHAEGEVGSVRGADLSGATYVISSSGSTSLEELSEAAQKPLWFQLYMVSDRGFTREVIARVEAAGCPVLIFTVDAPIRGIRDRDVRAQFALPPGIGRRIFEGLSAAAALSNPRPTGRNIYSAHLDPSLTWKDAEWICANTKLPVVIKGIMTGEDARLSLESGAAGVFVSNHGARSVDTLPGAIEALPEVADAVGRRAPILLDGGVRRGTDIVKAIALGASAVMIGRPYLYGLALGGAEGVRRTVDLLRTEFEMAMALTGRSTLGAIDRTVLW
jgi:4-hydroxymandelate oxidase